MVLLVPELWNKKSNDGREAVAVGEMTVVMVYPKAPENESYSRQSTHLLFAVSQYGICHNIVMLPPRTSSSNLKS